MKILNTRIIDIDDFEFPQIEVDVPGNWHFVDGRRSFPIYDADGNKLNLAQQWFDKTARVEIQPEKFKINILHSIEKTENPGGTLFKITNEVYLTLSQISTMDNEEITKLFVPESTLTYIKNIIVIK